MTTPRKLVTFDWALKRLLRSKANFGVLEGFLSELLHADIHIENILESEGNKESREDKFNRVDMLVSDGSSKRIIIEFQYLEQRDYLQRMLYGVSKVLTESLVEADAFMEMARVVSINILHFDLGQGEDYIYYGKTIFTGMHQGDELELTEVQKKSLEVEKIGHLFPEYYLLKVKNFNDVAKDGLDQWMYFFKHGNIHSNFDAKGLQKAQSVLDYLQLTEAEKVDYENYKMAKWITNGEIADSVERAEKAEREKEEALAKMAEVELQKEEERRQKEEERRQKEEERRQKEAALAKVAAVEQEQEVLKKAISEQRDSLLAALLASGMSEDQAKNIIDRKK